jgi:cyclic peptide transporter
MSLFKIFHRRSRLFLMLMVFLAVINSMLFSGILVFINKAIARQPLPFLQEYDWQVFTALMLTAIGFNFIYETFIIRLTSNILFDLEIGVVKKVKSATYQVYEKFGADKIYSAIDDTRVLAGLPEAFVNFTNAAILVICVVGYLFYISWAGGLCVLLLMFGLLVFYLVRNESIEKDMNKVRDLQNNYYRYLRDLLLGFREVKMSAFRSNNLFENFLRQNRHAVRTLGIATSMRYMSNELVGKYSWYFVLGVVLFGFPRWLHMDIGEVSAFLVTILFIIGPVATLIMIFPTYTRCKIALQRIGLLHNEIDTMVKEEQDEITTATWNGRNFERILFDNVVFEYVQPGAEKPFRIGPVSLEIHSGEVIFITGGNGSGKSTFINILTGLYQPASGNIWVNGELLSGDDYSFFSTAISVIFTDNYLFSENYDSFELHSSNTQLQEYIALMKLEKVIVVNDEEKKIDNRLSKGQRKRLALMYALLEDRKIIVLDEWAAEQDPQFRAYFYNHIIPALRDMGKTVIAVTHDDKYFDCASRILKFDYGMIDKETISYSPYATTGNSIP